MRFFLGEKRNGNRTHVYKAKNIDISAFLIFISNFVSKIKKAEGYFTLGNLFLFTFLCLCAEVKGNHHQHDVVYVIGVDVARNGKIAPNSDNGKCDDGFYFDKVCYVLEHTIYPFQGH